MSLADLTSIASIVSSIAVLASLIFLYYQMRQMTEQVRQSERNQRAAINQGSLLGAEDNIRWMSDPVMADLRCRVTAGETKFTARELAQLRQFLRSQLIAVQDNYIQFRSGLIDKMTFDNGAATLKILLAQPVFRALWKASRNSYSPEWASFLDVIVRDAPLAQPVNEVEVFEANLADILSAR